MRIDIWLVENGMAPSRQKAQELIATGRVVYTDSDGGTKQIKKSSTLVDERLSSKIRIEASIGPEFVSRGGLKLLGAVRKIASGSGAPRPAETFFENGTVFDCGISTGGFADCALKLGAKQVVGIDVGHGQLSANLKSDPRITLFEGVNARDFARSGDPDAEKLRAKILQANEGAKFDYVVVDVSFISLTKILPALTSLLRSPQELLLLVKPQFEVGKGAIGKHGVVRDLSAQAGAIFGVLAAAQALGWEYRGLTWSPLVGPAGNIEYLLWLNTSGDELVTPPDLVAIRAVTEAAYQQLVVGAGV